MAAIDRLTWSIYSRLYDRLWDDELTAAVGSAVVTRLPRDGRVLEVGAGTGLCTAALVAAGTDLVATEPNQRMRSALSRRCPALAVDPRPIEELDDADRFDAVVAVNVVHLTGDPAATVAHLRSLCRRGGRLIVVTPSPRASIWRVCRAKRACGVSRRRVTGFVVIHAALAPLLAARSAGRPIAADCPPTAVIAGVSDLYVHET